MNIIGTVIGWARSAWSTITGAAGTALAPFMTLLHYITGVHQLLSWITSQPLLKHVLAVGWNIDRLLAAVTGIERAFHRLAMWIWLNEVVPARDSLVKRINVLQAWTANRILLLRDWTAGQLARLRAYTDALVANERTLRIRGDQQEHAAMLARVAAALATVQRQAASGYNATLHQRLGVIATILNDLADREPLIKNTVTLLVKAVFDLETIDDPVVRWLITQLLSKVIGKLGIDRVTGDLISRLLHELTGSGKPAGLQDVCRDIGGRLNALEEQWAAFMSDGGPEVEQAGREWKALGSLTVDLAILDVFALAVNDPAAWATAVADTIGAAGNTALDAVFSVITKA